MRPFTILLWALLQALPVLRSSILVPPLCLLPTGSSSTADCSLLLWLRVRRRLSSGILWFGANRNNVAADAARCVFERGDPLHGRGLFWRSERLSTLSNLGDGGIIISGCVTYSSMVCWVSAHITSSRHHAAAADWCRCWLRAFCCAERSRFSGT